MAIIEARKNVGLAPASTPSLGERLRPVIAFGEEHPSPEVRSRFEKILAIANAHLPAISQPIEAWKLDGARPVPLVPPAGHRSQ